MSATAELHLCLCQMSSTSSFSDNTACVKEFLRDCEDSACELVVFPENVLCRGSYDDIRDGGHEEDYYVEKLGRISQDHRITIVWGGIPVRYHDDLYNVAMVFNSSGQRLAAYRKIHLFQLNLGHKAVDEGSLFVSGSHPVKFQLADWTIGLTICYDLRFPELFRAYVGADLILCPSDFTNYTGKAHWEVLLRARAIENQCYVAGINQCGLNVGMNVKSYGHSLLVDPWGRIVAAAEDQKTALTHILEKKRQQRVRAELPALRSITYRVTW